MQIWLNGAFLERGEASVSVFDAGFQHGVGLFETMGAAHGRVFRAVEHVARLAASATALRLTERLHPEPLVEAVGAVVERNGMDRARVRLTLSGGDLDMLQSKGRSTHDPTILVVAQPPTDYPDAFFEQGVGVVIAEDRDNPWSSSAGHKTLDYWARIRALQAAAGRGAGEALWLSLDASISGGCVSNLFLVRDGTLHTPMARSEENEGDDPSPVLPGITRGVVIEIAEGLGVGTNRGRLSLEDLHETDEAFLTNTSWGVLPVVAVEQRAVADGNVGPLTRQLRQDWLDTVEQETR